MPTYRIVTLGCKLNQADSAALEGRLRSLGMARAAPPAAVAAGSAGAVDLVVLNTCTVTAGADREARQIARRLRRAHPGALLIASGCYAERDSDALRAAAAIDHVVGTEDQAGRIEAIAAAAFGLRPDPARRNLGPCGATEGCEAPAEPLERTRAYLKVQDGCDLRCSYCVIPAVRGRSRSLPPERVLERIERLAAAGYREMVLTGVNTGDYGRDLDPPLRLHDLLDRALRRSALGRLRLNSLEPRTVTPRIRSLLASCGGRLARHLQVPLQSASDAVLSRMRRPYRIADYARVVEDLRAAVPEIGLGADVIVGFPGETEADFAATLRFVASSPLNYLHVFPYSPRPGTSAAALPGQVHPRLIAERGARLRALARRISLRFRESFVGRDLPALTLREVRPDGRLRALTDNFIDVGVDLDGRDADALSNRLVALRITSASETHTLARTI
ncbi:MAG: tRNA (N(6)-L-threonylcarbamoyladenosine(37)-C(2))-methylthiotransferase MtaB [Acidobacteriota bacterium]